jgi:D-alanyl-D-alanine carboxypeptidase
MKPFALFFVFLTSLTTFAQNINSQGITDFLHHLEKNNKMMGSVSIAQNGELIYHKNIGWIDVENNIKVNKNTKYRIASITKTFTSILILQAIEEGKLRMDSKLAKYFPNVKNADKITIEHLLRHTHGVFNFTEKEDFFTWNETPRSHEDMLNLIYDLHTIFEPGEGHDYSNTGYYLLASILEKIYQKSYGELLSERITKPLGLNHTYIGDKINPAKSEALGYEWKNNQWRPSYEININTCKGAGDMVSTGPDVLKMVDALMNHQLLNENSLKTMLELKENEGLGIFYMPFYQHEGVGHTGKIDAFETMYIYFPEEKLTICILINAMDLPLFDIHVPILKGLFGKDIELPDFTQKEKIKEN